VSAALGLSFLYSDHATASKRKLLKTPLSAAVSEKSEKKSEKDTFLTPWKGLK